MALQYDIKLGDIKPLTKRLEKAPYTAQIIIGEVVEGVAQAVAASAKSRVVQHPSGLWKGAGNPRYGTKQVGLMNYKVQTAGGAIGKAEAMSEFATDKGKGSQHNGRKYPKRPDFAETLSAFYGRSGGSGGGRILWAAYDEIEPAYIKQIEEAAEKIADSIGGL